MSITTWAVSLMDTLGGPGAGLAIAAENLFPPIPSEIILPLAGFAASRGELSLAGALAWTTGGSLVGASVLYALGLLLGRERLHALVKRMPLLRLTDVTRAEHWFARHGSRAVLLGRFVPVVRSLISVPAGVERMPMWRFLGLTALGSGLWNAIFVLAGYGLGERWHVVERFVGVYANAVVVGLLLLVIIFVAVRLRARSSAAAG